MYNTHGILFYISQIIINRFITLAKFGLAHSITSAICFWIHAIIQETLLTITLSEKKNYAKEPEDKFYLNPNCTKLISPEIPDYDDFESRTESFEDTEMIKSLTPYFYPFTIEFSILMTSAWILMLENIGKTHLNVHKVSTKQEQNEIYQYMSEIRVDCSNTTLGFFAGLMINVLAVISVIFFFLLKTKIGDLVLGEVSLMFFYFQK